LVKKSVTYFFEWPQTQISVMLMIIIITVYYVQHIHYSNSSANLSDWSPYQYDIYNLFKELLYNYGQFFKLNSWNTVLPVHKTKPFQLPLFLTKTLIVRICTDPIIAVTSGCCCDD